MIRVVLALRTRRLRLARAGARVVTCVAVTTLLLSGVLSTPVPAEADPGGNDIWSTPTALSSPDVSSDGQQMISDGTNVTAVWIADDHDVEAALSTDSGADWGAPVTISTGASKLWGLASSGSTVMALWEDSDELLESAETTQGSDAWSANPETAAAPDGNHFVNLENASLSAGIDPGTFVAALAYAGTTGTMSAATETWTNEVWSGLDTLAFEGTQNMAVQVAVTGDELSVVVNEQTAGQNDGLWVVMSSDNGSTWSPPSNIVLGDVTLGQLVVADGIGAVTWADGSGAAWISRLGPDGWTPGVEIASGFSLFPDVVAYSYSSDPTITATWVAQDGDVMALTATSDGQVWGNPVTIATDATTAAPSISVAASSAGVTAVWTGVNGADDVVAETATSLDQGNDWDAAPAQLGPAAEFSSVDAVATSSTVIASWVEDSQSGDPQIEAAYSPPEPVGFQLSVTSSATIDLSPAGYVDTDLLSVGVQPTPGNPNASWPDYGTLDDLFPVPVTIRSDLWGPFPSPQPDQLSVPHSATHVCEQTTVVTGITGPASTGPQVSCAVWGGSPGYYYWTDTVLASDTAADEGGSDVAPYASDFAAPGSSAIEPWYPDAIPVVNPTTIPLNACVSGTLDVGGTVDPNEAQNSLILEVDVWGPFDSADDVPYPIDPTSAPLAGSDANIVSAIRDYPIPCMRLTQSGYYAVTATLTSTDPNMLSSTWYVTDPTNIVDVTSATQPTNPSGGGGVGGGASPHRQPASPLAFTGTDATAGVALGVGLLCAGLAMFGPVVIRRRRRCCSGSTPARL